MKKLMLFIAVLILSISAAQAQDIRLGIKGGVNFATFSGDEIENMESITGFHIGILVEVLLTERFAIQPEIFYSIQGSKYEDSSLGHFVKSEIKLNYIQVPIMTKFYIIEGFAVEVGPQLAILTSSKAKYDVIINDTAFSYDKDLSDISSIEVSLLAGLSYRLPINVFFGARYNYGLTNLDVNPYQNIKNNVIQLSVGYSF
ncbi:MAG: porin family protein [Aequorivita antarctica]